MTFYRQAQSTEFTKHNDLCATEQIRAWHNGFRIVMQVNNMTYGMEVAAAGTVHQTGGVMIHGPLDNFFRLELTPGFIERNPYDNEWETLIGIHNGFPLGPENIFQVRKSVVWGEGGSHRVEQVGRGLIKTNKHS